VEEKSIRLPRENYFHKEKLLQKKVTWRIQAFCCHTTEVWNTIQPDEHISFITRKRLIETRYEIVQGS